MSEFFPSWAPFIRSISLMTASLAFGCARIPPSDDGSVSSTISERIDHQVEWFQAGCNDQLQESIQNLIDSELTADSAIQIALLNNPQVQAFFEELGIAQADLVAAGLLSNPSFAVEVRYPPGGYLHTNIEYLITSSLLDIFLIPLRTRLAAVEFEQTKLRVSNQILNLAFEVRSTFYELVAERKKIIDWHCLAELAGIYRDIVSRQLSVGNVNELEFQCAQSKFLEAEIGWSQSQAEVIGLKEKFNRLMGFSGDVCLKLPENLSEEIEGYEFDLCFLEKTALEKRLDLQVARYEIVRLMRMLGLREGWTHTHFQAGLSGERESGGTNFIGPGFSGELPIFNYGQAARMRLYAQLRQAQGQLAALEIRVATEVREACQLLRNRLDIVDSYRDHLLPMQHQLLHSSEALYNVMGLGIDRLIENKRIAVGINQQYIESLKNYLVAQVMLDRALGGNLPLLLLQSKEALP